MSHTMQQRVNGSVTAIGGLTALVIGLMAIDQRVRDEVVSLVTGRPISGELTTFSARAQDAAQAAAIALRDQSIEHAPLTIFALAALALVIVMTRIKM